MGSTRLARTRQRSSLLLRIWLHKLCQLRHRSIVALSNHRCEQAIRPIEGDELAFDTEHEATNRAGTCDCPTLSLCSGGVVIGEQQPRSLPGDRKTRSLAPVQS